MPIQVFDTKAKIIGELDLVNPMFTEKFRPQLIAQAIRVYLANKRQSTAKVKSRGEISGSTRKIYRQKGTGRARHGDRYAPIFVGGGVAHGPRGNQNHQLCLSQKMKRKALFSALSAKLKAKEIIAVQGLDKLPPKTKLFHSTFESLVKTCGKKPSKLSLILADDNDLIKRGTRNISKLSLLNAKQLNTYAIYYGGLLIFTKESLITAQNTFLPQDKNRTETKLEVRPAKIPAAKPIKPAKPIKSRANRQTKTTLKALSKNK